MLKDWHRPIFFGALAILACAGCGPARIARGERTPTEAIAELETKIVKEGSVTFRTWNGQWRGADCDIDITFLPGNVVQMVQFRDAESNCDGHYQVGADGEVSLQLNGPAWPRMWLRKDAQSLLLRPVQGDDESFWPLRPKLPVNQS
jgi:hypothetical protein